VKKITIKDVAEHSKSSISTVSMVVNNKGYVSDEKRKSIRNSIDELGYVPTASARNLASKKTNNIGFILRESHFTRSEPFYTRIFLGAEFESNKQNYYVLLATVPDDYIPGEDTPRLLKERNVDGIIIAGKVNHLLIEEVENSGIPFVFADYQYKSYSSISVDNRNATLEAFRYLINLDHKDICFIGADKSHPSIAERMEGYQLGMIKNGVSNTEDYIFMDETGSPTFEAGYKMAKAMMNSAIKPTAVICANDAMALGLMKYCENENINIPQDLAVVGFDDVDGAKYASPPLTTVRVFKEQFGELALKYLADLLEEKHSENEKFDRGNHALTVPSELVIRDST
jgi:LacI family transcriptional regulator